MQNVKQEWFSIPELLAIIHRLQRDEQPLPIKIFTDKGLSKKADRENWQKRQRSGVKGKTFEYYYSSFPIELQKELGFSPIVPHQEENKNNLLVADKPIKKRISKLAQKVRYIAGFSSLQVSAGYGNDNDATSSPDTYVPFSENLLQKLGVSEKNGVVFWANGNSMFPTIDDEDLLLIDTSKREIKEGKIYVVQHRGTMWVKRIRFGFNDVQLVSDNPDYSPIHISYEEAEDLRIVGQVVNITKSVM
ncbi:transcriptional regulator [Bibersteinia trehalosi Y31]|uniref:Transcriptional regulator n=1 Tax=Bibersteinia trehalosi Y31 TaxID=1261658 RepID=A0A179CWX7_BIBTR|nr:S24 family peptidase [Bibersteinia trehalosi]OAQ14409.1 transcriptional regulator [Bibersteinia trehalosi Y31]